MCTTPHWPIEAVLRIVIVRCGEAVWAWVGMVIVAVKTRIRAITTNFVFNLSFTPLSSGTL
jgi:hypothetical protein